MSKLQIFVPTVGESITFETLARIRKFTPGEYKLTVWYDACGRGINNLFYERLFDFTDDVILSSKNHGVIAECGFSLLYSDADYVMLVFADSLVMEDYYERIINVIDTYPDIALIGQATYNSELDVTINHPLNYPDHILLFNIKAVNEIGGICPSFKFYGHDSLEMAYRINARGWNYAVRKDLVYCDRNQHEGRDLIPNVNEIIEHNAQVFKACERMNFKYNWWANDLLTKEKLNAEI